MLAGSFLSLSTARCWQDKRSSHQGIEHRTIVSEGDLHTYLFVFIVNKLLRCVTSISYGNRGCWQACYLCLLPGAHKTLANTVNGQNRIFSHLERIPWPEFNFCVNMNLYFHYSKWILADMSSVHANWGNIIGTLREDTAATCNGLPANNAFLGNSNFFMATYAPRIQLLCGWYE